MQRGRFRAKFPFKSLDVAILYLRAAEVVWQKPCEIYEIENDKGRKEYKIFPSELELNDYLHNNKHKRCTSAQPLFVSPRYTACTSLQLRMLTKGEIEKYLKEHYSQYKWMLPRNRFWNHTNSFPFVLQTQCFCAVIYHALAMLFPCNHISLRYNYIKRLPLWV